MKPTSARRMFPLASPSWIEPLSGDSSPPSRWSSVDFPAPDAPVMATVSPAETEKEIPRKTSIRAPVLEGKLFHNSLTLKPAKKVSSSKFQVPSSKFKVQSTKTKIQRS